MCDYDDLIKDLREYAELVDHDMWDCPYMIADSMKQAADAIEELSRENRSLANTVNKADKILRNHSGKWISVEERLPEEGKSVLVCICSDDKYDITRGWYCKNQGFCCWDDAAMESADFITHWMPLPGPPKGE